MLEDGTYDVIVVDADDAGGAVIELTVTVLGGPHKGEVVTLRASGLDRDSIDLLAVPGSLVVASGVPSITLEG